MIWMTAPNVLFTQLASGKNFKSKIENGFYIYENYVSSVYGTYTLLYISVKNESDLQGAKIKTLYIYIQLLIYTHNPSI